MQWEDEDKTVGKAKPQKANWTWIREMFKVLEAGGWAPPLFSTFPTFLSSPIFFFFLDVDNF